ncbi:MAG: hypothetical protein LQ351_003021 [Letrouitia transgressa]|nr:MAG: hypothetical protein LQ351_003021 [Letrouitia transgressa]
MSSSSTQAPTQSQPQPVNLTSLPLPSLTALKNQLNQELTHLTTSFTQLRTAQSKFRDCIASIQSLTPSEPPPSSTQRQSQEKETSAPALPSKPILVPLTPSLYVPGHLRPPSPTSPLLVDVGTGFYVEKTPAAARAFYAAKVEELGGSLRDLEGIVQGKQANLTVVEDVLRQKMIQENSKGDEGGGGGAVVAPGG